MPVLPTILFRNYITTKHVLTYLNHSQHNYFCIKKERALKEPSLTTNYILGSFLSLIITFAKITAVSERSIFAVGE